MRKATLRALGYPRCSSFNKIISALFIAASILYLAYSIGVNTFSTQSVNQLSPPRAEEVRYKPIPWVPIRQQSGIRIVKASILYDRANSIYADALTLHDAHNKQHGYQMHVLRTPVVKGFSNRLYWLQSLIVEELQIPRESRAEWLLYTDPSILINNTQIPAQTFLPPATDRETFKTLSLILTKPPNNTTINTSVMFLRISGKTLNILTKAINLGISKLYYRDWQGVYDVEATVLHEVLQQEAHRGDVIYQPAEWYNSSRGLFRQTWGGDSHFAELQELEDMVRQVSSARTQDDRSLEQGSWVPNEDTVGAFWNLTTNARQVLDSARDLGYPVAGGEDAEKVRKLRDKVELEAWDRDGVVEAMNAVKELLGLE